MSLGHKFVQKIAKLDLPQGRYFFGKKYERRCNLWKESYTILVVC